MKSNQVELPGAEECLVSKAATFFAPDYAPQMSVSEWQESQKEDKNIEKILNLLEEDKLMKYKRRWRRSTKLPEIKEISFLDKWDTIPNSSIETSSQTCGSISLTSLI